MTPYSSRRGVGGGGVLGSLLLSLLIVSIGCDGVIGSKKRYDRCGICGGNETTCHIISGIYTRRNLPYGYNKVTTIPTGACNINITEMRPSGNYLALKKSSGDYILNGNWALGYSNDYQGAGTVFKYHRPLPRDGNNQLEYIVAKGPTNESLDVMILKQQDNRGVMYMYTIPTDKYTQHTGNEQPFIRHAAPPVAPRFISKEAYGSQVAALDGGRPGQGSSGQATDQPTGGADLQNDEADPAYDQRYQAYLAKLRRRQELAGVGLPAGAAAYQRGTSVAESRAGSQAGSQAGSLAESGRRTDYDPRPGARHRQRQLDRKLLRGEVRLRHGRQKVTSGRARALGAVARNATGSGYVPPHGSGSRVVTSRRPARPRQGPEVPGLAPPKPGINYGLPSANRKISPYGGQSLVAPPVVRQPIPAGAGVGAGIRLGGAAGVGVGGQLSAAVGQQLPAAVRLPRPGYGPTLAARPRSQYRQLPRYQQRAAQALSQPLSRYLPANVVSPYKRGYDRYQSWLGPLQAQTLGGAVNDQIAVSLPGSGRRPELGLLDTSADYSWKITGFTECSRPCGEGEQQTIIVCVKVNSQAIVTDDNCDNALKPDTQSIPCNTHTCPPAWEVGAWGPCSTTCDRGQQTRTVECKQRVSKAVQLSVSATRCQHLPKPSIVKACNEDKLCVKWKVGEWSKCSSECGRGQRTREVVCVNADDKPIPENACTTPKPRALDSCDMGSCAKTWFYSAWSTECSTDCGTGVYTRDVYCSADQCRAVDKPSTEKPCKNDIPCGGKWFTGPWGKCTVTCGVGVMKRPVLCIKRLGKLMAIVDDENCLSDEKPEQTQPCQRSPCQPQWYTTDWTECSKSCGTGFRSREVKCLSADKHPTSVCDPDLKPDTRLACNMLRCPKSRPDPGCKDKFNNCLLVVQARLCSYDYYRTNCCLSCTSHEDYHSNGN